MGIALPPICIELHFEQPSSHILDTCHVLASIQKPGKSKLGEQKAGVAREGCRKKEASVYIWRQPLYSFFPRFLARSPDLNYSAWSARDSATWGRRFSLSEEIKYSQGIVSACTYSPCCRMLMPLFITQFSRNMHFRNNIRIKKRWRQ